MLPKQWEDQGDTLGVLPVTCLEVVPMQVKYSQFWEEGIQLASSELQMLATTSEHLQNLNPLLSIW